MKRTQQKSLAQSDSKYAVKQQVATMRLQLIDKFGMNADALDLDFRRYMASVTVHLQNVSAIRVIERDWLRAKLDKLQKNSHKTDVQKQEAHHA